MHLNPIDNQNTSLGLFVEFYGMRDIGKLLAVYFDPTVGTNASTDFGPNEPVRVGIGPSTMTKFFAGIVHTIAHEFEHVRRLKEVIILAATHELLGEAIEMLSENIPEAHLETLAPGTPGHVAGFASAARRGLDNWNNMPLADRQRFRDRFFEVRGAVIARVAAGTPAQQALHNGLVAGYNAVVVPPP